MFHENAATLITILMKLKNTASII